MGQGDRLPINLYLPFGPIDHRRVDNIKRADKRGDKTGLWEVVNRKGCADLLDPSFAHHYNPVRERKRLFLIMGDIDRGDTQLALDRPNLIAQANPNLGVQGGKWLIEQQQLWADRQGPRQRHALLLAAGELIRVTITQLGQPDQL